MNEPNIPSIFSLLIRYARPWSLLAGALTYFLGAGIAKYLGHTLYGNRFWTGLLLVLLLLLASHYLKLYYDLIDAASPLRRLQKDAEDSELAGLLRLPRQSILLLSFTILTAGAATTALLIGQGALNFPAMVILGSAFLLSFFLGVPPFRLAYRGYGELAEAVILANLFPALAFIFQTGDLHRLLPMLTFPLLALYLAMRLAQSLKTYIVDQRLARRTMMIVIGWQRGMQFHNLLILTGYLLLALAAAFGLPWSLTWPGMLSLPVGLFQIYQMSRISNGAKPDWRMLRLTAAATFGMTAYLLGLAIWTG
jgi:1,4-dihydroxy-2-naphthoate octaprenyltransferase